VHQLGSGRLGCDPPPCLSQCRRTATREVLKLQTAKRNVNTTPKGNTFKTNQNARMPRKQALQSVAPESSSVHSHSPDEGRSRSPLSRLMSGNTLFLAPNRRNRRSSKIKCSEEVDATPSSTLCFLARLGSPGAAKSRTHFQSYGPEVVPRCAVSTSMLGDNNVPRSVQQWRRRKYRGREPVI
jgi:hypothetical protein